MLRDHYMHPSGQIPAYEWNFGDVNPPVHAFATIFAYNLEKGQKAEGDREPSDWLDGRHRADHALIRDLTGGPAAENRKKGSFRREG